MAETNPNFIWLNRKMLEEAIEQDARARRQVQGCREFLARHGLNPWLYRVHAENRVRSTQQRIVNLKMRFL